MPPAHEPGLRMLRVLAYVVSTHYIHPAYMKPFNPVLGETCRARGEGAGMVLEQVNIPC